MDESIHELRLKEGMGTVSAKLESLQSMICTACMGLKDDKIEKQAIDVIECIGLCIGDIKNFADNILEASTQEMEKRDMTGSNEATGREG